MLIASIYKIVNHINGKVYIGFTKRSPLVRWGEHIRHAQKIGGFAIQKAIAKYGFESFYFEVIYQSKDILHCHKEMEKYFIDSYQSHGSNGGYNMTHGGEGNGIPRYGLCNPFFGKKHTKETKETIGSKAKGRTPTEEARENMRLAQLGRKHSPETIAKIGIGNQRNVYMITKPSGETVEVRSLSAFAKEHELQQSELSRVANGQSRTHKGFIVSRVLDISRPAMPTDGKRS
jgi:group I intron endonuclease